mmetsp:Transcript_27256/g.54429  ORF Transcript_27256/g.54429 Transcript_27256/m.54429 type:complete len:183 (+) Transcript_27256:28-576(+)|eukprot:CAMPEP_0182456136 /NCGR_PEP_ID=MMETSP1319-20130603/2062_1 /TAXON_ID=172717 /ORGANISM="Bolidomonas pacifica, Strain RCC208" /LENGTH=182 /DNA_ID=CAMNT_0024654315 /DNA_START=30 /DNA_END=578 /DNA_ORIENTATION=-
MLVYTDLITGDEMMSDSYPREPVLDAEGEEIEGMFQVASRMVVVGGDDVDIGCGNAFGGESEDAKVDDSVEKENNIISEARGFGYTEMPFNAKSELKTYLKEYFRRVRSELKSQGKPQEEIKAFMGTANGIARYLVANFSDLEFYTGRSMNPEGSIAFAMYHGENATPHFMYIEGGLRQDKF